MDSTRKNKTSLVPKSIICDVCKKTFKRKFNLKVHKRIHTGVKPYKCEDCDKSFTQKGVLKRHMLVHSGKKKLSMSCLS